MENARMLNAAKCVAARQKVQRLARHGGAVTASILALLCSARHAVAEHEYKDFWACM